MKKLICIIYSLVFLFSAFNLSVFADEIKNEATVGSLTKEIIIEQACGIYDIAGNTKATGLITQKTLTLSKTSTQLILTAKTKGTDEVDKCGFTYIKLQRLINGSWVDYSTYCYSDLYSDSDSYIFSTSITPPSGYTYRVIAEHYAAKKLLFIVTSKETSYNETSSLSF